MDPLLVIYHCNNGFIITGITGKNDVITDVIIRKNSVIMDGIISNNDPVIT